MSATSLTNEDFKPWAALPETIECVRLRLGDAKRVLDVGAGLNPFPYATHTVDVVPQRHTQFENACSNFREDRLPYEDKFFDFVYCRHTVEDLEDPTHLLREMSRVGRRGYIETPSPMAEVCRGIDGGSPQWRGYWHHHSFVWQEGKDLVLLPKLTRVEFLDLNDKLIVEAIRANKHVANTYFFWDGEITVKYPVDESHVKHMMGEPYLPYDQLVLLAVTNGYAASAKAIEEMSRTLSGERAA